MPSITPLSSHQCRHTTTTKQPWPSSTHLATTLCRHLVATTTGLHGTMEKALSSRPSMLTTSTRPWGECPLLLAKASAQRVGSPVWALPPPTTLTTFTRCQVPHSVHAFRCVTFLPWLSFSLPPLLFAPCHARPHFSHSPHSSYAMVGAVQHVGLGNNPRPICPAQVACPQARQCHGEPFFVTLAPCPLP